MKNQILIFLMILQLGCGQSQNNSNSDEKNIKLNDTIINSSENKYEYTDKFTLADLDSTFLFPENIVIYKFKKPEDYEIKTIYDTLKHLPSDINKLVNLKELYIIDLNIEDLPNEIGQLSKLEKLFIDGYLNAMNITLPSSIGQLQNLKELHLYGALDFRTFSDHYPNNPLSKIKELPKELGNLLNLEILDLGRNGLKEIPIQVASLKKLKILRLKYNDIEEIPDFISNLKDLQELDISSNGEIKFPNSLNELKNLKILMGNDYLTLKDQEELRKRFPEIEFSFENEWYDAAENEDTTKII